jgi:hypothetical protein
MTTQITAGRDFEGKVGRATVELFQARGASVIAEDLDLEVNALARQASHLFDSSRLDRQSGYGHVGVPCLFACARDQRAEQNGHSRLVLPRVPPATRRDAIRRSCSSPRFPPVISFGTCTYTAVSNCPSKDSTMT